MKRILAVTLLCMMEVTAMADNTARFETVAVQTRLMIPHLHAETQRHSDSRLKHIGRDGNYDLTDD